MGRAPTSTATLDHQAMIAANSALGFIAVMASHLGPRASLRQAKMLLMVATREPVDRKALGEASGRNSEAALDDLHRLCATDRDGEPGLGLVQVQPKPRDYRSHQYVLTARGQRAVRQIATAIEALKDAGCGDAVGTEVHRDDALASRSKEFAEEAPVNVTSALSAPIETVEIAVAKEAEGAEEAVEPAPRPRPQANPPQRRIADAGQACRLPKFKYKGISVRAVQSDGVVWFVAGDVCKCLGRDTSAGTAKALRYVGPDDRCVLVHTGVPAGFLGERCNEASGVSLSGSLKLIRRTKGPGAKAFEQWVHDVVIPRLPSEGRDDGPLTPRLR